VKGINSPGTATKVTLSIFFTPTHISLFVEADDDDDDDDKTKVTTLIRLEETI
jgi:hypothetical protein